MYSRYSSSSSNSFDDGHSHISSSSHHKLTNTKLLSSYRPSDNHHHNQAPSMTSAPASKQHSDLSLQCLRFKYFSTFFICTICLALLAASLATQKWLVSRPIRVLRFNNGQVPISNQTALMLTAFHSELSRPSSSILSDNQNDQPAVGVVSDTREALSKSDEAAEHSNKFQGKIYFGLFSGLKVLNYGFGDRVSQLSVAQTIFKTDEATTNFNSNNRLPPVAKHDLVHFNSWLLTLGGLVLAMLFALVGSIFAIINFVIVPRGTVTGPAGLVTWNAAACACCLLSILTWLVEYFIKLKWNVLTSEEVQNGWTSENRSQFGYSYYFVVSAFLLHLVNVIIVSAVHSDTWTSGNTKEAKRQASSICEGVIMLY